MNDNNGFLSGYNNKGDGNKSDSSKVPAKQPAVPKSVDLHFEQQSGFKKPKKKSSMPPGSGSKFNRRLVPIAIGVVVFAAIVIVLLLLLGGGTQTPDFSDWEKQNVSLWAKDNGVKLQVNEAYSDEFDEGRVFAQSIPAGKTINKGELLEISVSLGHDPTVTLPLPDLATMTKEQIEAWADENYMTKVRVTAEYSDEVPSGNVIRYEINDDTVVDEVKRNTPIYIIVSKGSEDAAGIQIEIPDFKTMAISECYIFANDNGLVLTVEERYDDYVPKGSIISQSIKAEQKIAKGEEILLVVSKGKKITVPDFSSYSKDKALSVATELGIPVTITERYSSSSAGANIGQSIDAGSVLEDGDFLELTYSVGNEIVVPSFVGQTRDAIESWANELNLLKAKITIKSTYTQSNEEMGTIVHQDIANTVIGRRTTINITVSSGKAVFVPDFVGPAGAGYDVAVTREKALEMCEAVGIIPVFVKEISTGRLPGEIWHQSVGAGSEVSQGSTITLKFTPANATTTVPDFTGKTRAEVEAGTYNQSLYIVFIDGDEPVTGYEGKIYEQSEAAGTTVVKGTKVTLHISPEAISIPEAQTPTPAP